MTKYAELEIWGRKLNIKINYDCYDNEEITENQVDSYNKFINNYVDIFEKLYCQLELYCKENYTQELDGKFDNIFKYIMPTSLYIKRSKDDARIVGVMCNFKFEQEHGLVAIFKNEQLEKIDFQDAIL